MSQNPASRPDRDAVYRLIQWVMLGDVAIGIVLVGIGAVVMDEPAFVIIGVALAVIGFALFLFFRMLARRAGAAAGHKSPHDLRR